MKLGHFIVEPLDGGWKLGVLDTKTRQIRVMRLPCTVVWAHFIWPIKMYGRGYCSLGRCAIGMFQTIFMGGAQDLLGRDAK